MNDPNAVPRILFDQEAEDVAKLETLVRDLRRYAEGGGPTDAEIASAPLVDRWNLIVDPSALRAAGLITGHPLLGDTSGVTSRIYAADRYGRWIRTYSRLWRLGRPIRSDLSRPD